MKKLKHTLDVGNDVERIKIIKCKILPLLKKHEVIRAGLFGSFVRGDFNKKSDIDILIRFKGSKSLFDFVGLKLELENRLKRKVDLVEYIAIHPILKNSVFKEEVRLL